MKRMILTVVFLTLMSCTLYAAPGAGMIAGPEGSGQMPSPAFRAEKDQPPCGPKMAAAPLQLSEEQLQKFWDMTDKERKQLRELNYKSENIMDDIHKMERSAKIDFDVYEKLVKQLMSLEADKLVVRARTHAAIRTILSEEQLKSFPPFIGMPEAPVMTGPDHGPRGPQGRPGSPCDMEPKPHLQN